MKVIGNMIFSLRIIQQQIVSSLKKYAVFISIYNVHITEYFFFLKSHHTVKCKNYIFIFISWHSRKTLAKNGYS